MSRPALDEWEVVLVRRLSSRLAESVLSDCRWAHLGVRDCQSVEARSLLHYRRLRRRRLLARHRGRLSEVASLRACSGVDAGFRRLDRRLPWLGQPWVGWDAVVGMCLLMCAKDYAAGMLKRCCRMVCLLGMSAAELAKDL